MHFVPTEFFRTFEDKDFTYETFETTRHKTRYHIFTYQNGGKREQLKIGYHIRENSITITHSITTQNEARLIKASQICHSLKTYFEALPEFRLLLLTGSTQIEMPRVITDLVQYQANQEWNAVKMKKKELLKSFQTLKSEFSKRCPQTGIYSSVRRLKLIGKEGLHLSRLLKEFGVAKVVNSDILYRHIELDMKFFGLSCGSTYNELQSELCHRFVLELRKLDFEVWTN